MRPGVDTLRRLIADRRGGDAGALDEWSAPDVLELSWMLGRRLCRGALLRARLGSSGGLVFCARGVRVVHARHVRAGRDLDLEDGCFINGLSRRGVTFGDRCTVGRGAIVAPSGLLGGEPGEGLLMGDHSNLGAWAYVGCSGFISIGSHVLMGPRVSLLAEDHNAASTDAPIKAQGVTRLPIAIEDDVWLGAGVTVVSGVTIGRGSIVAAGSVVTRDVAPFSVVAGVPAALVRSRLAGGADSRPAGASPRPPRGA
jgi:acetyltransferase-like isoleucine patch superfamily enzyme